MSNEHCNHEILPVYSVKGNVNEHHLAAQVHDRTI